MSEGNLKWAALGGGLAIFLVTTALCLQVAPLHLRLGHHWIGFLLQPTLFVAGFSIGLKADFAGLLSWSRRRRSTASERQRTELKALYGKRYSKMFAVFAILLASWIFIFLSPLFSGTTRDGLFVTGYALLAVSVLVGTLARLREIAILAEPSAEVS
jgi:hypothetical protein